MINTDVRAGKGSAEQFPEISVVIPTFRRCDALRTTLESLKAMPDCPHDILVHADAGDNDSKEMLQREFPNVRFLSSDIRQGPGGGRNRLVEAASTGLIVSLDDDSWPLTIGFFDKVRHLFKSHPDMALLSCRIIESDETSLREKSEVADSELQLSRTAAFVGCGCAFRRSAFLEAGGYLPIVPAYGMEETDLALKLVDRGAMLLHCADLLVFHDCDRSVRHADPQINAAQITNTALLVFLRYPVQAWPIGLLQTISRIWFSIRLRRFSGILKGVRDIPTTLWRNRMHRNVVRSVTIRSTRRLR